ncbi:hypothetical protein OIU79_012114 [Salix purpurea]|uniref:Uncharacterized protein n=1 Tax=Salix purpurea TaxID=77065 RepID=A0A9Q0Q2U8_SALPP|nr:hypothetical protein OIU79_012114 [Salix purpurea]
MLRQYDGRYQDKPDIKEAAVSFYSESFTAPVAKRACLGGMGFKKLSPNMAGRLEVLAPIEEVKEVVWNCDGSKGTGSRGICS